jgi:hypothetical protein
MAKRHRIPHSDHDIGCKLLLRLARHTTRSFCLFTFYDYDIEFLAGLTEDLGLPASFPSKSLIRRLKRVCRGLENCGVLRGRVSSCHKEYIGEPVMLKSYRFGSDDYLLRLAPDLFPHYTPMMTPQNEASFLVSRAFPEDY